jgi:hypothetical protein
MNNYACSNLILVEGLTGSGKSVMAHYIARQLQYNGIPANWVHEGDVPHPILIDFDASLESYLAETRANWVIYTDQVGSSTQVRVLEACFFNNLLETLFAHNVARAQIVQFATELQTISKRLNPTLIYLVQDDVENALERNFSRRGIDFRNYVIEFATSTPLAKARGWEGYAGMLRYWQAFVALTDELFQKFSGRKLRIDNTAGDWDAYNRQVLAFLAIPKIDEQKISPVEAAGLVGLYQDRQSDKKFAVFFDAGVLTITLFLNVRSRMFRIDQNEFVAEGWPFEISFEVDDLKGTWIMKIGGRDVDYLPLVGTVADRVFA